MSTTAFDYYGVTDDGALDVKPISEDFKAEATAIAVEAINASEAAENCVIRMGRVYDRKGWMQIDGLGEKKNTSYTSVTDDYIVQVTVRVPYETAAEIDLDKFEEVLVEDRKAADRLALEAEIAADEAAANAAAERIAAARARLEKMQ